MQADARFIGLDMEFWANVRAVSQASGYTARGTGEVKVHTPNDMRAAMGKLGLGAGHLVDAAGRPTSLGRRVAEYSAYRADVLNRFVRPRLMDVQQAKSLFMQLQRRHRPRCPLPLNKQKGEKRSRAYFTCIVNMLIEAGIAGMPCDYDPRALVVFTRGESPLCMLSRRMDGCFPGTVNPVAVWEIKEYYHTTTFGSRVADGVYETILDGLELAQLRLRHGVGVGHFLFLDARYTWWECGRSYLCRMIDLLHMGCVDEILFGSEVIDRLPRLVRQWVSAVRARHA
mgnify:CR=1 FL=1